MDPRHLIIHHRGTQFFQLVDNVADQPFVAGDGGGGDDDQVVGIDIDGAVIGMGHPRKGTHRLTLGAGGDDSDLAGREGTDLLQGDQRSLGHLQISQLVRHRNDALHRPPRNRHFAPKAHRGIDDLLHPMNVGGKGSDDDAFIGVVFKDGQ